MVKWRFFTMDEKIIYHYCIQISTLRLKSSFWYFWLPIALSSQKVRYGIMLICGLFSVTNYFFFILATPMVPRFIGCSFWVSNVYHKGPYILQICYATNICLCIQYGSRLPKNQRSISIKIIAFRIFFEDLINC